jgi:hypothetical protein
VVGAGVDGGALGGGGRLKSPFKPLSKGAQGSCQVGVVANKVEVAELERKGAEVQDVLQTPDEIRRSQSDPTVFLFILLRTGRTLAVCGCQTTHW